MTPIWQSGLKSLVGDMWFLGCNFVHACLKFEKLNIGVTTVFLVLSQTIFTIFSDYSIDTHQTC